jgi:hypothetical protein
VLYSFVIGWRKGEEHKMGKSFDEICAFTPLPKSRALNFLAQ